MKKICKYCKQEFETDKQKKICCSQSCRIKQAYIDNPDFREKISKCSKERWKDTDYRKRETIKRQLMGKDPTFIAKMTKINKERGATLEFKEKMSEISKNCWADEDFRKKMSAIQLVSQNIDSVKEANRQRSLAMWRDYNFKDKHFKSHCRYKEFELPSGRIVKLQGYEPAALKQLLETYSEEDILCEVKSINEEIGIIVYMFENNEHTYYPDFYIKSTNTIIEVKSTYTFDLHKEKNLAKEQACIQQGFNFKFMIL